MTTLDQAVHIIRNGGIVAFPTETVYGLGGDATQCVAIQKIYAVKGRPSHNPLILHFGSLDQLDEFTILSDQAYQLAQAFWPGPMTLLLPKRNGTRLSALANAGLPSLAVRIPSHPTAQAFLKGCNTPIAAPSANTSGQLSPTTADHVHQDLGDKVDLILDGPQPTEGIESTIIDLTQATPILLRPGSITHEDLCPYLPDLQNPNGPQSGTLTAPGQLESHYAPKKPLRLNALSAEEDEILLGFGPAYPKDFNLSPTGNLREAAQNLYAFLHQADQSIFAKIAITPLPHQGIGLALNDRLRRAAFYTQ